MGALVVIGDGTGSCWGCVRGPSGPEPLSRLVLVGPGMHVVPLSEEAGAPAEAASEAEERGAAEARWSRTVGALGGLAAWRRLVRLRVGIVGCGRTGSLMAVALARVGVRSLTLLDPDVIEPHNLGEMGGVVQGDVGAPKVEALARRLRTIVPEEWIEVRLSTAAIDKPDALGPAAACDVLICSVDNDAARLATTIVATIYQRVLIDVGTGVFARGRNERSSGADVRLVLPGDGCLLCRGNLTDFPGALDALAPGVARSVEPRDWTAERAGSLGSLNQLAASLALGMREDLFAERLTTSLWAHVEREPTGRVVIRYPLPGGARLDASCRLCAKAGQGDAGLGLRAEAR